MNNIVSSVDKTFNMTAVIILVTTLVIFIIGSLLLMLLAVKLVISRFAHNIDNTFNFMGNHKFPTLTDNNMSNRLSIIKITSD